MITGKKTALALTVALLSACGGGGGATVLNISAVEAYRVADKTVTFAYIESESPTVSTLNKAFSKAIASAPLHDYWSLVDMGGDVFEVQLKQPPKVSGGRAEKQGFAYRKTTKVGPLKLKPTCDHSGWSLSSI